MAGEPRSDQAAWGQAGLATGSVIAGYRVLSRIGAGGMAMVFRAQDESLGRVVALKILAPGLVDDAEFRERFVRESRAAAAVDHPHIIPVYGAGEANGVLYIAMRYANGGDLRALLQREGPLSPGRAAFLLSPLASALDAGHATGLVHRDVKPANVLIDTSPGRPDHLYLSDFGLAKGTASTGLTGTGHFLGTLEYCAPEQIGGKPVRPQTDQYALACVVYTMFTGRVPFPHDEPTAILWAHVSAPPPSVTALRPDLPPAVDAVIARAMAKAPEQRYASCTAFADALRAALGIGTYAAPSQVGPPPVAPPPVAPQRDVGVARPGTGPAAPRSPTEPRYPADVASTTQPVLPWQPGSPDQVAPRPARRPGRRARLVAAAGIVIAGGATAAGLLLSGPHSPGQRSSSGSSGLIATLTDTSGQPTGVAFESDSTVVAVDNAGNAYTWDIATSNPAPTPTNVNGASAITEKGSGVSPDGDLVAIQDGQTGGIELQDTATGNVVTTLVSPGGTNAYEFAFSPDGTELAAAGTNGTIYVWQVPHY